jgi:hypothetical protein
MGHQDIIKCIIDPHFPALVGAITYFSELKLNAFVKTEPTNAFYWNLICCDVGPTEGIPVLNIPCF